MINNTNITSDIMIEIILVGTFLFFTLLLITFSILVIGILRIKAKTPPNIKGNNKLKIVLNGKI